MELTVDLHSHSGHAGGVGNVSLESVAETMALKGIHVYGTGDCLQPDWLNDLENGLVESAPGLYRLGGDDTRYAHAMFLLQSEIIITADVPSGGRKGTHVVLLFPNFSAARQAFSFFERRGVKLGMGRPFLKCENADDVTGVLAELLSIDERILVIPAHVLTPQGIYGSDHPVDRMSDFFGEFAQSIKVVETGLSADPEILALIPELDGRTLLSNSDCHSPALNRVGREFTTLSVSQRSYDGIFEALNEQRIVLTAEFTPAEGRYFLTGHREGKKGHEDGKYCYFSPEHAPADNICPICGKDLTIGVLQRALYLGERQGDARLLDSISISQKMLHVVPLIEVIAASYGVKSISSKKVMKTYHAIIEGCDTEVAFFRHTAAEIERLMKDIVPEKILKGLIQVANGDFTFDPLGYDGMYGELCLGKKQSWFGHNVIYS